MEGVLLSLKSTMVNIILELYSMDETILDLLGSSLGSLIIFAAIGIVAYSVSINIDHPTDDPILLKFSNLRRYSSSNGFHIFAIINFIDILLIFITILLECCKKDGLPYIIPFCGLLIGVWLITYVSIRDLLWKTGR